MNSPFPQTPSIRLYDPLADLLGAGDGLFHYRFDDVVKVSGHACPTVAGAFLMTIRALGALYGGETPVRGGIEVSIPGAEDQGVNGPISQVFSLLTGAAGRNGFQGLGGQHARHGLLRFEAGTGSGFGFRRRDTGAQVRVGYDPSAIPPHPGMMPLMQRILQGDGDPALRQEFRTLWRDRVIGILEDAGECTVTLVAV